MLNKIMLIGNLGKDPEMNYTQNGTALTKFSLAVSRSYKTSSGEKRDETEWFNIVAWDKLAELCNQYLHKGSKAYIEGRVSQRKYTDKNGIERYAFDVVASDMEMLSPKPAQSGSSSDFLAGNADDSDPLGDLEDHPF
ncbi:MAG: single-stranded DNA-binding protein [Chloroflexi bacterium]|nr:MAG: single-stranded DNA-binding protein [Chloroflexota bacterium]TMD76786.1 MAG: single-stranded DNA-binding protein [Chloroflexota bacterium]